MGVLQPIQTLQDAILDDTISWRIYKDLKTLKFLAMASEPQSLKIMRRSKIKLEIETGNKNFEELQNTARETLISRGWDVDYIALRQGNTLAPAQINNGALVVLGAAKLGKTRLIDNLEISAGI